MKQEIEKILFWLLDEKHNLDSGICEQITGRADKDYLLGLQKSVNKSSDKILSLFEKLLDGEAPMICRTIQANWNNNSDYMCNNIIQNIKNKLRG
jgi:hypothetical protein